MTCSDRSDLPEAPLFDALPIDALPDALVVLDDAGVVLAANAAARRLFGAEKDMTFGVDALEAVHPDDEEQVQALLRLVLTEAAVTGQATTEETSTEQAASADIRVWGSDGWRMVAVAAARWIDGCNPFVVVTMRDLTDHRRWGEASSDDQFRTLIQSGAAITMLLSEDGSVRTTSGALDRQLGLDANAVAGRNLRDLVVAEDRDRIGPALDLATERRHGSSGDRRVSIDVMMKHRIGRCIPFQLTVVDLLDDPTVAGFVVTGHDVTELHETREELAHTASHDSLTGLLNRAALSEHITESLAMSTGTPQFAVAFLDLDRFKPVNDLYGHEAGDELLIAVAGRLGGALRTGDIVARFGGDEFVIVAAANDLAEAHRMAERLEASIAEPFRLSCGQVQVYASVGVVLADERSTVDSLLTEADTAMYSVKHGRRGNPGFARRSVSARRSIADALPLAFEDDQFVVHYQPIVDLVEHRTVGYEALVRWDHPERGLLLPNEFLDVVEELGREGDLGDVVLTRALQDLAIIDAETGGQPYMSVNASARQLADPALAGHVRVILAAAGVESGRLTIEVSERSILERTMHGPSTPVLMGVQSLKALGVKVAADDFGTGSTSLTNLVSYPIDALKIDRSFISGVLADEHRRTIVSGLVALARDMGLSVVAEGVEELAQSRLLRDTGCHVAQGFLFGRAMPVDDVVRHRLGAR